MIITIDGPPGSGKSTVAHLLSERLSIPLDSAGRIFRQMAKDRGVSLEEFGKIAESDDSIDRELDRRTIALAKKAKGLIMEGRLTGIMLVKNNIRAFKVYVTAPLDVRAGRVAGRDGQSASRAREAIEKREGSEGTRYKKIYGITQSDESSYDFIIDTDGISAEQAAERIAGEFGKWYQANS